MALSQSKSTATVCTSNRVKMAKIMLKSELLDAQSFKPSQFKNSS